MKSEIVEQKGSEVTLQISLDDTEWKAMLNLAASDLAKSLAIPGFRPGKAPLDVVINQASETRVVSTAAELAINKHYLIAVQKAKLMPISPPKISVEKISLKEPLVFKAEIVTMPEVKLGDYRKIKVEAKEVVVDPERLDGVLKNMQRQRAEFKVVDRQSKMGDWVEIDFEGKLEGKLFDGGSSKNHPLIIGDGVFLPDFEKNLVGLKSGEEKIFQVKFPANYQKVNLAAKEVEFTIKIHQIKEVTLPELNDEIAKTMGDFKSLDALKADIQNFLKQEAEKQETERQKEGAITQLIALAEVEIPDMLVMQEIDAMLHDFKHQLEHRQMTIAQYLTQQNMTEDKLKEGWKEPAKKRVIAGLALASFREKECIKASDKDISSEIDQLKKMNPQDIEQIEEKYKNIHERERLRTVISGRMAIDYLLKIATGA